MGYDTNGRTLCCNWFWSPLYSFQRLQLVFLTPALESALILRPRQLNLPISSRSSQLEPLQ